jgi:hypothetical protein
LVEYERTEAGGGAGRQVAATASAARSRAVKTTIGLSESM